MKAEYKIFVEGVADKRFLEQLMEFHFGEVNTDFIINTDGYTKLLSPKTGNTYLNLMKRTTDDGGVNLVIFDADNNCEERKKELLEWKEKHGADFELFLLPDNQAAGELEDLLEQIINPENQAVMNCWNKYEHSIQSIQVAWKKGMPLTTPAKKTKIYAYLEVLLGSSKAEKSKIKEKNREYTNSNHWDLNNAYLQTGLIEFLDKHLRS